MYLDNSTGDENYDDQFNDLREECIAQDSELWFDPRCSYVTSIETATHGVPDTCPFVDPAEICILNLTNGKTRRFYFGESIVNNVATLVNIIVNEPGDPTDLIIKIWSGDKSYNDLNFIQRPLTIPRYLPTNTPLHLNELLSFFAGFYVSEMPSEVRRFAAKQFIEFCKRTNDGAVRKAINKMNRTR